MDKITITLETGPGFPGNKGLAAAAVVFTARQIQKHGLGNRTIFRAPGTKVRSFVFAQLYLANTGCRGPVALLDAGGDKAAIRGKAKAIGIAKTRRQHFDLIAPADPANTLITRGKIPAALGISLQPDDKIMPTG
jgi:hypothetical protein